MRAGQYSPRWSGSGGQRKIDYSDHPHNVSSHNAEQTAAGDRQLTRDLFRVSSRDLLPAPEVVRREIRDLFFVDPKDDSLEPHEDADDESGPDLARVEKHV
ncbi:hypothetical protein PG984_011434 [Apiospora sp. TS-2023a]